MTVFPGMTIEDVAPSEESTVKDTAMKALEFCLFSISRCGLGRGLDSVTPRMNGAHVFQGVRASRVDWHLVINLGGRVEEVSAQMTPEFLSCGDEPFLTR